ncbi:Tubulin polyglutamylase TTLL4 [Aphelenchoides besseyi]|nr:Tubulin polyglutamylase TTLL4 [Aphelenchoides besseyi]
MTEINNNVANSEEEDNGYLRKFTNDVDGGRSLLCLRLLRCLNTSMPSENSIIRQLSTSSSKQEPLLRLSLFEGIPPFIIFYKRPKKSDVLVKKPPNGYKNSFKWCQTTLLSHIMKRTLKTSHFELVPETSNWLAYYGKHLHTSEYKLLNYWQRVNHFPADFHIGRKDRLWQHLLEAGYQHCMPFTYILPKDFPQLREYLKDSKKHVILKPPASARGRGIQIVSKIEEVPTDIPLVAQRYVDNPLIINGYKFDLRLYVYVASLDPLRIYIRKDGLVRFASVKLIENDYDNPYQQLTNFSLNKLAKKNGVQDARSDLKWTLDKFREFVTKENRCWETLWTKIKDIAAKSIVSCLPYVLKQQAAYCEYPFLNRELFGMDILVDSNFEPYILEMNISPSMQTATEEDVAVKASLISDVLNMWRMQFIHDDDLETADLSYRSKPIPIHKNEEHLKKEIENCSFFLNTSKISPSILSHLTDADLRYLIDFEDEFALRGSFELIFPAVATIEQYLQSMETTYPNLLLTAWISLAEDDRLLGIERLKSAAALGAHFSETNGGIAESTESTETETSGIVDL